MGVGMLLKLNVTAITFIHPSILLFTLPLGKLTNGKQQVKLTKREFRPLAYRRRYPSQVLIHSPLEPAL